MSERRFPPPWTVEKIPGGLKVIDANGQSLAYVYSRENANDAAIAKVLTEDEARRIAANIATLPELLATRRHSAWAVVILGLTARRSFHAIAYEVLGNVWLDCL